MSRAATSSSFRQRLAAFAPAGLLLMCSLIALPVFLGGLACSHDAFIHLTRAAEVYFNAQGGFPFLQWSPDLMRGYGHPILAFYAPLAYWLLAAPHWLGIDFATTFRALSFIALPVGGVGLYLLARRYLSVPAAFVGGLAYLFAPYLLFDAIQRGALPEALALALLPYSLAAFGAAARRRSLGSMLLAGLLFAILISLHNLVPLFAVPLALLTAATEGLASGQTLPGRERWLAVVRGLVPGVLAIGLAMLMTISIWLPALVEVRATLSGQAALPASPDLSNWPRYYANLVPLNALAQWPAEPGDWQLYNEPITRSLGVAPAVMAGLAMISALHPTVRGRWPVIVVLGLAGIGCLFLASQPSRWLWDVSRSLQVVQLPTRFLGPASLAVALLSGLFVELALSISQHPAARLSAIILPAVAATVCGWPWLFPRYCTPLTINSPAAIAQPRPPNNWMYDPVGELLPQWVQALPPEKSLTDQYSAGKPVNRLIGPPGTFVQVDWQTHPAYDRYVLEATQPVSLTYQSFYFVGWEARLDGQPIAIGVTAPTGLMTLSLPSGRHTLEISFQRTPLRTATLGASALGVALWLLLGAVALRGRRPAAQPSHATADHSDVWVLLVTTGLLLALFFGVLPHLTTPVYARRLSGERLAGVQHPASIVFESEIRYLGYQAPAQVAADQEFEWVNYWKAEHPLGVPYTFAVRLADAQGHTWNLPPNRPFDFADYQGAENWPANAYLRDAYLLHLLPGAPPGRYWVEIDVFRRDTSLELVPEPGTPTSSDPAWARVGQIDVRPPRTTARPAQAQMDTFRPTPLGVGLTLAGWSLPPAPISTGDSAHVTLLWQAGQHPDIGTTLDAQLIGGDGQLLADFPVAPGGDVYPLSQWPSSAVVRDQVDWRVPASAGSGSYRVSLRAGPTIIELGQLQVSAPEHRLDRPPTATSFDQSLGFARLVGYTLSSATAKPGDSLSLQLVWQAISETVQSYRVFVHLRGPDGLPITQSDAVPGQWTRPTTGWVPGEYIVDTHSLTLPPNAASGSYSLVVGLYEPANGERLGEASLIKVTVP